MRELEEQASEREEHGVTAFTELPRCGNSGSDGLSDLSSNEDRGCWLELGGVQKKPRKQARVLK